MLPLGNTRPVGKRTRFWAAFLASAFLLGGALLMALYRHPGVVDGALAAHPDAGAVPASAAAVVTLPDSIKKGLPSGLALVSAAPGEKELWAGKLLLIDPNHPVPEQAPAPNTLSIAAEGEGKIAVRTLKHSTALEVIKALEDWFMMARTGGVGSWLVWEGTRSNGQQLELQMERLRQYAQTMTLAQATERAAQEVPSPGCSEHQLPYVVDIRLASGWDSTPETMPLSASPDGRLLLDTAWEYGFIYRYGTKIAPPFADEAYHFRYVGIVHSTIMHAMNLDLDQYLHYLQKAGTITYYENGTPRYAVLCKRADKDVAFSVPQGSVWEASMDNTGFAVLAVTFPPEAATK